MITVNKQPQLPTPRFENTKIPLFVGCALFVGIWSASSSSLWLGDRSSPQSNGLCEREYYVRGSNIVSAIVGERAVSLTRSDRLARLERAPMGYIDESELGFDSQCQCTKYWTAWCLT
jgi:hypothetical protein